MSLIKRRKNKLKRREKREKKKFIKYIKQEYLKGSSYVVVSPYYTEMSIEIAKNIAMEYLDKHKINYSVSDRRPNESFLEKYFIEYAGEYFICFKD